MKYLTKCVYYDLIISVAAKCEGGWTEIEGSCYQVNVTREVNSFNEASDYCDSLGAFLAEIPNASVNQALLQDASISNDEYWTGGNEISRENDWVWVHSGNPIKYFNWVPGEPNDYRFNSYPTGEDCILITPKYGWRDHGKGWIDVRCSNNPAYHKPLCQKSLNSSAPLTGYKSTHKGMIKII